MKVVRKVLWEIWLPIVLIALWWILSANSQSFYFPPLSEIFEAFRQDWLFDRVPTDLFPSLRRWFFAYAIALILGIGMGLILGISRSLESMTSAITEFFRAMPSVAKLPIMVLFFGLGDDMKIALMAIVGFFPVLLNTIDGVRSLDPMLRKVAAGYHIRFRDRLFSMYIPAASPQVFAGARIALSLCILAMIVAEMIGLPGGLGSFILDAQRGFKIPEMWSGILVLGTIGYIFNKLFLIVEHRALAWHRGMNQLQG